MTEAELRGLAAEFLRDENPQRAPRSISGRRGSVYLKHAEIDLAAEAEALHHAQAAGGHAGVEAIRLLGYDSASNVLLTEYVEGSSLFNALWNSTSLLRPWSRKRYDWPKLLPAVFLWLARFHAAGAVASPDRVACRNWITASMGRKSARLVRMGGAGDDCSYGQEDADRLEELRADALRDPGWDELAVTRIHGDFTYANLLLDGDGGVKVLDFADSRTGFALEDVVRLWSCLWEICGCGPVRRRTLHPCMEEMLRRYGLEPGVVETAPFRLLRAWNALNRLCEVPVTGHALSRGTRRLVTRMGNLQLRWLRSQAVSSA